jgi:hypothetical protein
MIKSWIAKKKPFSCREYTLICFYDELIELDCGLGFIKVHKDIKQLKDVKYICKIVVDSRVSLPLMEFPCLFHLSG